MTAPTTTAATPEELARTAWDDILKEMDNGPYGFEAEEIIAAAIRQHSEAQRAEIERLSEDLAGADEDERRARTGEEHALASLHVAVTECDEWKARATAAEAALADLPSLIAVIGKLTGAPMDDPAGYGIDDCVAMLEEHEAAVAGIGWQIGLTGETERADRAEARTAAAVSDASRHERLWRAAMRRIATYRALLAASRERERAMREVLTLFTKARYLIANRGPANTWSLDRLHEAWVKACDCLPPAHQEERQ